MSQAFPFPIQQELTAIALAYRNQAFIADQVMPRVTVPGREFKWQQFTRDEMFTVPDTTVGRKGSPNEVQFSGIEQASFVRDYGLDDLVPIEDVMSAPPGYDPIGRAVEGVAELIALDREIRVANTIFNLNTYPVANRTTLSGTSQWSDYTNSDPYTAIMTALEGMLLRPNVMVIGRRAWNRLRVHPIISRSLYPNGGQQSGAPTRSATPVSAQAVADLLELDAVYVGEAFVNTARPGQPANMQRVWGNHAAFLHMNPAASIRGDAVTFGFTAEWGNRVAGQMDEPKIGLRGSRRVRVGESVRELVVASDVGYYFQNAVA